MSEETAVPSAQPKPTSYTLTEAEQAHMAALVNQEITAKMQVYQLNKQLETLQGSLRTALSTVNEAERMKDGAISLLSAAHGFKQSQLSANLKTLTATVL